MTTAPVCDVASARTGRCPECHARILVPFDYCDGWADSIGTDWVRAGKRIIEAHTDVAHPERPVRWERITPVEPQPGRATRPPAHRQDAFRRAAG